MEEHKTGHTEDLGGGVYCRVSPPHTFGTDAFLLSRFAAPKPHETAVDLGTGCGIIPLLWFRAGETAPKAAVGLELQEEAVSLAEESIRLSGLEDRLQVLRGDLRALPGELPDDLHLVTCNPPYKRKGSGILSQAESDRVARHEQACTLDDVCAAAARLLRHGGRLCVCQLPERLPDLLEAMRRHRIEPKRLRLVQERADTAPWLLLCEGRLGSGAFFRIEPPFLMRENGADSAELQSIYRLYRKAEKGEAEQ